MTPTALRRLVMVVAFCCVAVGASGSRVHAAEAAPSDPLGILRKPIPEKLVVLTFDDSCASHATYVGPLLKKYGFGGTFYVSDAFAFRTRKDWYMTWEQIKRLDEMGFEIGNHTLGHGQLSATGLDGCLRAVTGLEEQCTTHRVTRPTTFCWPFYSVNSRLYDGLIARGYLFARGGHNKPYKPTADNPFDAPSFSISDGDIKRDSEVFYKAVKQATPGQVVVLTFHGVADGEHPTVGLDPAVFETYVRYLKDNQYTVISMRDLAAYVEPSKAAQLLSRPPFVPWGERSPAWGWVTARDNLLYLCVDKLPADRQLTLPAMTTRISAAWFLADTKKQPLVVTRKGSGIQTVTVPEFSTAAYGEKPTVIVAELTGGPVATLLDFVFPGLPEPEFAGDEIRVQVPLATDLTKLAPVYNTGSPLVTGKPVSGTQGDFSGPQKYTIAAPDGSTRVYTVKVTPTAGVVGLSSPSFERYDLDNDRNETLGRNPTGTTWTFHKPAGGGELGIKNLAETGYPPPAPDGTLHCVFMRGEGNGVSQAVTFDKGSYTIGLDVAKRRGYEKTAASLTLTLDGATVFTIDASNIVEAWKHFESPAIPVPAGVHVVGIVVGGGGMDLIDNVVLKHARQ
ncbi:polysaccharide deacetylase family protein [Humisphaera borealis]|uniref:Polysaccharide deacetylase family protein n=1 Tax=Humisphaera borealis TaxID=2807512 RepID=A0A7M2WUK5_9BACT|nr:polysaccharide deacetylase family protein [Humisphaera borealis]QOV89129.1 polysaccharide deacetylase family protein [Humisphaera borealis]